MSSRKRESVFNGGSDALISSGPRLSDKDRADARRWLERNGHHDLLEMLGLAEVEA